MKNRPSLFLAVITVFTLFSFSLTWADELRIALFDFEVHAQEDLGYLQSGISALLPPRIAVPGQINVIENYRIHKALSQSGHKDLPAKTAVAKKFDADYLLFGSITKIGDNVSIDARLVDVNHTETSTPVFIQSIGMDNMIPEISNFAQKIRGLIIGTSAPTPAPPSDKPDKEAVWSKTRDLTTEKVESKPFISEEPVYASPPRKKSQRLPRPEPPKPVFQKTAPLFENAPFLTHVIKHRPLHYLASGDINNDGKTELLVAGVSEIYIYQLQGNTLARIGEIQTKVATSIIHMDIADINNNGTAEIYVSSYEGHFPNSLVFEYQKDRYEIIAESKLWFFRITGKNRLLGQRADTSKIFSGPIHVLEWSEGKIISREEVLLPGGVALYGYTENDIDEDINDEYIAFHQGMFSARAQLVILSYTGRIEWQDSAKIGGSPNTLTEYPFGDDTEKLRPIPMRILCEDYNHDDRLEVITVRNSKNKKGLFSAMIQFNQSEVLCLQWNGADLITNWTTGMIKGYTTDYLMTDLDSDGRKELTLLSVSDEGFWGKAKNTLAVYQLAE